MSNALQLLSEIAFASFFAYSPRGSSEISRKSRSVRDGIKFQTTTFMNSKVVPALMEHAHELAPFLGAAVALVPTPRSSPQLSRDARWPAREICQVLAEQQLGRYVIPCIERVKAVGKSAFATPGGRPNAKTHLETLSLGEGQFAPETTITVVDDFITKGNTLLAACSVVKAAFPNSTVRGFAMVRTCGLVPEIERIKDICRGRVRWQGNDCQREP